MPRSRSTAPPADEFGFPAPDLDAIHDPGHEAAARRAEELRDAAPPVPLRLNGCEVRVGTASWTDPTLLASGLFYPPEARDAESRLRYYAERFSFVEVDSSYYALPTRRVAELWVERTPPGFVFDLKAHALMTGQPSDPARLPKVLRDELPRALAEKPRLYPRDLPPGFLDAVWALFLDAIGPLRDAGKLGAVILQYPRWFVPSRAAVEALVEARARLGDVMGAVELRNHRWFADAERQRRLFALLEREGLPYVMVDGPQGLESSVPAAVAVTSPALAVVRLHGRRGAAWEAPGVATVERYRYLYDRDQLSSWADRVSELASRAERVHVTFNNCHGNYGTTNAIEFAALLQARSASAPA